MRRIDAAPDRRPDLGPFWNTLIRFGGLIVAVAAVAAMALVGLFVILPLMVVGGIALHFYIRRRLRQARQFQQQQQRSARSSGPPGDGDVIDAEYTIIDRS